MFHILRLKEYRKILAQNGAGLILIVIQYLFFKHQATNRINAFTDENKYGIDKSLLGEETFSRLLRYLIDRSFKKTSAFFDLRFEDRTYNFW